MNAFQRSWEITRLSFDVIKKDKGLLLFPFLGFVFSAFLIASMVFPAIVLSLIRGGNIESMGFEAYIMLLAAYFGLSFIGTFFNVCAVYTIKKRFDSGNATFIESIRYSVSKIHLIFLWSLVAATVGILIRAIENSLHRSGEIGKVIGRVVSSMLGAAWGIITSFVVPGMVYHDLGPIDAIKKSAEVLRKTWGESLIRHYGLGIIEFVFVLAGIILGFGGVLASIPFGAIPIILSVSIALIYILIVILVFNVANAVFNTALYVYADSGKIPSGYNEEVLSTAFRHLQHKGNI